MNFATHENTAQGRIAINDNFRAYTSYLDAADDYGRMLSTNPRYVIAFAYSRDAAGFAEALQRCGYATDPSYASKLQQVIKAYHLDQYDTKNFLRRLPVVALHTAILYFSLLSQAAEHCPIKPQPVSSENEAIAAAEKAVRVYKLSPLSMDCISFEMLSYMPKTGYLINVREKHSDQCGGDPLTAPRLFSMKVAPDGRLASDANRIDGILKPLACPKVRSKK